MSWYYLSFADSSGWLGGCYVEPLDDPLERERLRETSTALRRENGAPPPTEADLDFMMAVSASHKLGCNPGGEVRMLGPFEAEAMDGHVPAEQRNRLLSREDMGETRRF